VSHRRANPPPRRVAPPESPREPVRRPGRIGNLNEAWRALVPRLVTPAPDTTTPFATALPSERK
jgi:hypothetical protein